MQLMTFSDCECELHAATRPRLRYNRSLHCVNTDDSLTLRPMPFNSPQSSTGATADGLSGDDELMTMTMVKMNPRPQY